MQKPAVFIGSSTGGLGVARAIKRQLDTVAQVTIWDEGFFDYGTTFIEALMDYAANFDFALLILTSDDLIISKGVESFSPRDNVIFELGLFMGKIGRSRTFILRPKVDIKMPSDLAGVKMVTYDWPREDNDIEKGVEDAAKQLASRILSLGISDRRLAKEVEGLKKHQQFQDKEIQSLRFVLQSVVTKYECDKLEGLNKSGPFMCHFSGSMIDELRRLRALNLVKENSWGALSELKKIYANKSEKFDLKAYVSITEMGQKYLTLKSDLLGEE